MTQANEPAKQKLPRGIKITLILSLALNLVVVGMIVGAFLRKPPPFPRAGGGNYVMPYFKALSEEERRMVFKKPQGFSHQAMHRARHAVFEQILAALRAEPFDKEAVAQILKQQSQMSMTIQSHLQEQWLDLVAEMSPEKRLTYAQAVAGVMQRHKMPKEHKVERE